MLWQCTGTPHTTQDTSLHWYPGTARYVSVHPGHSHTSVAAALAPAPAPPSLPVSKSRRVHPTVELRELITHHVLHPAPLLGWPDRRRASHCPAAHSLLFCQYGRLRPRVLRDWAQGATHLLQLWSWSRAVMVMGMVLTVSGSGSRSGVLPLQLRLDHPILYHRVPLLQHDTV